MSLPTAIFRAAFKKAAGAHLWDPRLLEAQALQESSGKTTAFRYEPAHGDGSFGLLQVMGNTARKLGLPPGQAEASLCDPYIGLEFGCRALVDIVKWVGCADLWAQRRFVSVSLPLDPKLRAVLARYNGGGKDNPADDGSLRNEDYVRKVELYFESVVGETG